jgi:hypothetical protein
MSKKNVNTKITHIAPASPKHPVKTVPVKPVPAVKLLESKWLSPALMLFLLLFVALLYFPAALGHMVPKNASDVTQWQGAANKIIGYNKAHADNALWTESMFSGMPSYMISFPNRFPWLENLSRVTDHLINWRIFLLFIGALGVFLLLRFLKMDPWTSFFGAVAFMFSCHWLGLVEIGHNTKFRAIMFIPWVVWAFMYLRRNPGLLSLGFLATTLIMQLRENHPQISYYLYLFLGMYWLWQLIESIREKDLKKFGIFTGLLVVAFGLTVLAVLNPYLSTMEYSKFTQRGGTGGLETGYAQGWSFHPLEILTLIIPQFYGGVSPEYWGYMPFTQIYNYFGLLILAFGVVALIGKKHRRMAIFLWIASFIFLLMSFGSFAPKLSDLFLKYLPYFNKFRVPSMILTMVQFNAVLLAVLGLDTILQQSGEGSKKWSKGLFTAFWICGGVFILWLILAKTAFGGLTFSIAAERAQAESKDIVDQLASYKTMRLGLLYKSGILSLLFLTVGMGLSYLHSIKRLPRIAFVLLLTLVVFVDLYIYTGRQLKPENLQAAQEYKDRFAPQDYDDFLLEDKGNFRIYPIDKAIVSDDQLSKPAGEWAYHHQTIMGYSSAKLERYDKLLKYFQDRDRVPGEWRAYLMGLFAPSKGEEPREKPMPILDMLSVKYLIHPGRLPYDSLLTRIVPVYEGQDGTVIYQNKMALDRAWFVESVQKVAPADSILPRLRSGVFDPHKIAFVETDIKGIQKPDSTFVKQTVNEMQKLGYDVYTDKPAFLVLSEIYYPAGWKATLDGKEIPIYPANYILRGLHIPAGKHKLELTFAPASYKKSVTLSFFGLLLSLLALLGGGALWYLKTRKAKADIAV